MSWGGGGELEGYVIFPFIGIIDDRDHFANSVFIFIKPIKMFYICRIYRLSRLGQCTHLGSFCIL